jgi:hypothetical protein
MNVNRGATTGGGLSHYPPQEVQGFCEAGGKAELEGERRRFPVSGLREIGGKESVDNDGMDFALLRVGEAVAAFYSTEETLGHEEALLIYGGRKHHIIPQFESPAPGARRQVRWAGGARRLATANSGNMFTNAKDRQAA